VTKMNNWMPATCDGKNVVSIRQFRLSTLQFQQERENIIGCQKQEEKTSSVINGYCRYYYDNTLQKNVYQTVEIFPSYDKEGMNNFVEKIIQEIKKKKIVISQEEALWNNPIIITFIVNEKGHLENIQIDRRKEEDYSNMDKEVLKIIEKLRCKKWNPGICNNQKVSTLVYIPIRIDYRNGRS